MLIELQKRKCLRCGHLFTHGLGGVVLTLFPKCPLCGSRFTIKLKKENLIL